MALASKHIIVSNGGATGVGGTVLKGTAIDAAMARHIPAELQGDAPASSAALRTIEGPKAPPAEPSVTNYDGWGRPPVPEAGASADESPPVEPSSPVADASVPSAPATPPTVAAPPVGPSDRPRTVRDIKALRREDALTFARGLGLSPAEGMKLGDIQTIIQRKLGLE